MGKVTKIILIGFFLLAFLGLMPYEAMAQDIDARIKRLEELEARIDAKIRKLEEMEVRLDVRLQAVATETSGVVRVSADGKRGMPVAAASVSVAGAVAARERELLGGQVSFRGGYTHLDSRNSELFTGHRTGEDGWMAGGALDVPLLKDPWFNNSLLGQIAMDFSGINGRTNRTLGGTGEGRQSIFKIAVSPKYQIDTLGDIRPWIIPIGLSFLVNSPASESVAFLTVGGTTGAGVEYVIANRFSLGLALSYNFYSQSQNRINTNHFSIGPYLGINY